MRKHKTTKWEAWNELTAVADELADRERDLRDKHPKVAKILHRARMGIGYAFNREETEQTFGLPDFTSCACSSCLKRRKAGHP